MRCGNNLRDLRLPLLLEICVVVGCGRSVHNDINWFLLRDLALEWKHPLLLALGLGSFLDSSTRNWRLSFRLDFLTNVAALHLGRFRLVSCFGCRVKNHIRLQVGRGNLSRLLVQVTAGWRLRLGWHSLRRLAGRVTLYLFDFLLGVDGLFGFLLGRLLFVGVFESFKVILLSLLGRSQHRLSFGLFPFLQWGGLLEGSWLLLLLLLLQILGQRIGGRGLRSRFSLLELTLGCLRVEFEIAWSRNREVVCTGFFFYGL